ncbi:MAG: hypothetical protein U5L45_20220 [Saprospiraceae bacterium]|nr:hypothetical protein [Saprospiraceae bacterium]
MLASLAKEERRFVFRAKPEKRTSSPLFCDGLNLNLPYHRFWAQNRVKTF